jgi:hypothetical protein
MLSPLENRISIGKCVLFSLSTTCRIVFTALSAISMGRHHSQTYCLKRQSKLKTYSSNKGTIHDFLVFNCQTRQRMKVTL